MKALWTLFFCGLAGFVSAQSNSIFNGGNGGGMAIGCFIQPTNNDIFGGGNENSISASCFQPDFINVEIRAFLEGPFNGSDMNDDLRSAGLIPLQEPYAAIFGHVGNGGNETVSSSVLAQAGGDAIVDWVFVELRSSSDNTSTEATRSALIQRDGDIVDVDGSSSLVFDHPQGDYFVSIRHRNHNGVMTLSSQSLSRTAQTLDLTDNSIQTFGQDALKIEGPYEMLWSGNVNGDNAIKYIGAANDRDPILTTIGGSVPTNTVIGYFSEDTNMDGTVKYIGANNDRDPILINIGGSIPTTIRIEQLP